MEKKAHDLDYVQIVRYYMAKDEYSRGNGDFSYVFHHVDIMETSAVPTSDVSMGPERFPLIRVNPKFFEDGVNPEGASIDWSVEVLKHNLWHLLCGHVEKRIEQLEQHYGRRRVQAAADLVVNQHADAKAHASAGIPLITPDMLGLEPGQTLEYYISELQGVPEDKWPAGVGQTGEQAQGDGKSQPQKGEGSGEQQSVGVAQPNATKSDIQDFVEKAEISGKLAGHMPGEAEEYINQLNTPPQVDWDYYLKEKEGLHRGKLTRVTKSRPSRRCDEHYGRRHIGILNIAFIVDTSGSMSNDTLSQVGPEIDAISERGAEIMIVHADYGVAKVFPYIRGMDLGEFFGRGGTSFCPAFEHLKTMEWQPDFCVYFTDGYGDAPSKAPYDTLWVLVDDGMEPDSFRSQVCDWGTICKIRGNPLG